MRSAFNPYKGSTNHESSQLRQESANIMKKLQEIKQSLAPPSSNVKLRSQNFERLNKYLPEQHMRSINSREGQNYRKSLQSRLQKLFKEEKDMLKVRRYKEMNQFHDQHTLQTNQMQGNGKQALMKKSNSMEEMERKSNYQNNKYLVQDQKNERVKPQFERNEPKFNQTKKIHMKKSRQRIRQKSKNRQLPGKTQQNIYNELKKQVHLLHEESEAKLSQEIAQLKSIVSQVQVTNGQLIALLHQREQKRRYKKRTKQILSEILLRLEMINKQVHFSKIEENPELIAKRNELEQKKRQILRQLGENLKIRKEK